MSTANLKQTTVPVTSKYGWRILKNSGIRNLHEGTDFAFGRTMGVSAFGSGTVVESGTHRVYGNYVKIRHAPGIETSYHSLNTPSTYKVGDWVNMGDILGTGGTSAMAASGAHVHVGFWLNGNHKDLEQYLTPGEVVTVSNTGQVVAGGGATPFPNDPTTLEDEHMIKISAPNRGAALIGPGYYRKLSTDEEVQQADSIATKVVQGNDRQFDIWVSLATSGNAAATYPSDSDRTLIATVSTIAAQTKPPVVSRSAKAQATALPADGSTVTLNKVQDDADTNTLVRQLVAKPVNAVAVDYDKLAEAITAKLPATNLTKEDLLDALKSVSFKAE